MLNDVGVSRRYLFPLLLLALTSVIAVALVWGPQLRGMRVTVINNGPEALSDLVIHVTGSRHQVGRLPVGEARTILVSPKSESGVELTFEDHSGKPHRLNAGGYIEPGYRGTIEIELRDCAIKRNDHQVEPVLY